MRARPLPLLALLAGGLWTCDKPCTECPPNELNAELDLDWDEVVLVGVDTPVQLWLGHYDGGATTVFDLSVDDPEHWVFPADWPTHDCDEDGELDCARLPANTEKGRDGVWLEGVVRPDAPGPWLSTLTWWSDELRGIEQVDGRTRNEALLAAWAVEPCLRAWPEVLVVEETDGEPVTIELTLESCVAAGQVLADLWSPDLEVSLGEVAPEGGEPSISVGIQPPLYVLPEARWTVDLVIQAEAGTVTESSLVLDTEAGLEVVLPVFIGACEEGSGVDCGDEAWTDDDGDGLAEIEGDCDDARAATHPGAEETGNSVDDDCDGVVDNGTYAADDDGDGYSELDDPADCWDDMPWVHPGAEELCTGWDHDCDGVVDEDACPELQDFPWEGERGCACLGGGAGALLLVPLLGLRRRGRAGPRRALSSSGTRAPR